MNPDNIFDELRIIAKNGLNYADNEYDRHRYNRILDIVSNYYANRFELPPDEVTTRFKQELGHITPKVGSVAGITDDSSKVLLVRRSDTNKWSLPGGWLEPNESPEEASIRETKEETGLNVVAKDLLTVFTRRANEGYGPHGAVGLLYYCEVDGGSIELSSEVTEVDYVNPATIDNWHQKHQELANLLKKYSE